jgi:signal transduction histidine kinase
MSTTRKYGGTGLGLNLVQKLVEAHGGAVRVMSKMGEGTVFCFNLKVCHAAFIVLCHSFDEYVLEGKDLN